MAATLTGSGELLYASFPIDKVETDADGDLIVFGKASDGLVDSDQQVVAPSWMRDAAQAWKESGANLRVQHNPQRDPAGIGLEVETDATGATWLKGLVIEPIAKKLVAKGALRAYSVGIAHPTIERDPTGKARGGIITNGELVEISLVDRPANKRCGITLVKSADDGTPEYVGKVFGADDAIAKALGEPEAVKGSPGTWTETSADISRFGFPEDLSVTFTPADMAKLFQGKIIEQHYDDLALKAVMEAEAAVYKRDIDTATRRRLRAEGKALPNLSYPIETAGDLENAAHLARTGHGDVAAARKLIARRARELGVKNPLDGEDSSDAGKAAVAADGVKETVDKAEAPEAQDAATPDLTKEPAGKDKPVKKAKKKPKKLPPWLNKPADGDGDSDGDASKACKSATDHLWTGIEGTSDIECSKCHTTPAQAAGVTASPMDPAPVGDLQESSPPASVKGATPQSAGGVKDAPAMKPVAAHREPDGAEAEAFEADSGMSDGDSEGPTRLEAPTLKASPEVMALLRFKSIGIDPELGRLHDLTCPAYHPDEVAKYHPFAELASLIDEAHWQRKALDAACGPLEHAIAMQELTASALALKAASEADVNDWRLEAHKAFRDANPGPGTYPAPGAVSPRGFCRPLLEDGRSATSPGHSGPNVSPVVATVPPNAQSFDRPPLSSGQTSPSPSFMKWDSGQYPAQQGVPVQLSYAHLEKDKQRMALVLMHDHLSRQFPEVCPLDNVDLSGRTDRPLRGVQPEHHPVPPVAGIGKAAAEPNAAMTGPDAETERGRSLPERPEDAVVKATPESQLVDDAVYKGFKKQRKKLGRKVLSGKMTVDEARSRLGRQFAQKGGSEEDGAVQKATERPSAAALVEQVKAGVISVDEARKSFGLPEIGIPATQRVPSRAYDPIVAPPPAPVAASFGPADIEAAVTKAVTPLLEKIREQDEAFTTKLAEQQRVIDAIADQPDPSTASFSGLAFQPVRKAARPAGVTDIAEAAARARRAAERELENLYESASDPFAREGFYSALNKVRGGAPNP